MSILWISIISRTPISKVSGHDSRVKCRCVDLRSD